MICYDLLCYDMLRYVMLCYDMLHYAVLCYIMLCAVLCCSMTCTGSQTPCVGVSIGVERVFTIMERKAEAMVPYHTRPHYIVLILYYTIRFYSILLYYIIFYTILYYTKQYYTILHRAIQSFTFCFVIYCTILYYCTILLPLFTYYLPGGYAYFKYLSIHCVHWVRSHSSKVLCSILLTILFS